MIVIHIQAMMASQQQQQQQPQLQQQAVAKGSIITGNSAKSNLIMGNPPKGSIVTGNPIRAPPPQSSSYNPSSNNPVSLIQIRWVVYNLSFCLCN